MKKRRNSLTRRAEEEEETFMNAIEKIGTIVCMVIFFNKYEQYSIYTIDEAFDNIGFDVEVYAEAMLHLYLRSIYVHAPATDSYIDSYGDYNLLLGRMPSSIDGGFILDKDVENTLLHILFKIEASKREETIIGYMNTLTSIQEKVNSPKINYWHFINNK